MYPARPMPLDFQEYVLNGSHSLRSIRKRYRCGWEAIRRWLAEADIHQTSCKRLGRDSYEVIMCDLLTGKEIDRFHGLVDAAAAVNGSPTNIGFAARGMHKTAYGFKWRYANDAT